MRDSHASVRAAAAQALEDFGVAAKDQVPALAKVLGGAEQWESREAAAQALSRLAAFAASETPALVAASKDDHFKVRVEAVEALGKVAEAAAGELSSVAVPALTAALEDEYGLVQFAARDALEKLARVELFRQPAPPAKRGAVSSSGL